MGASLLINSLDQDTSNPQAGNTVDDKPEPDPAAEAAATQQALNAEAANLLASANALLPSVSGRAPSTSAPANTNTILSALLDDGPPSGTSTAAVNSLLGDTPQQDAAETITTTAAVSNLLTENDPQDPNAPLPVDPFYQPPPIDKSYGAGLTFPMQDQQMTVDLGDSVDQPDPSMFDRMKQAIQSAGGQAEQQFKDGLNKLVAPAQSLIAPTVNDPGVQAVYHVIANGGATMPLTTPTDSGDTMFRNVAAQAWVGNLGGRYSAGTKMVDQSTAFMSWAQANVPTISGAHP